MGWFNRDLKLKPSADIETVQILKRNMGYAEAGHLVAFFFLLIVNGAFIFYKLDWMYVIFFFFMNIVFNMYLVLLQQYNKRRIDKVLIRFSGQTRL